MLAAPTIGNGCAPRVCTARREWGVARAARQQRPSMAREDDQRCAAQRSSGRGDRARRTTRWCRWQRHRGPRASALFPPGWGSPGTAHCGRGGRGSRSSDCTGCRPHRRPQSDESGAGLRRARHQPRLAIRRAVCVTNYRAGTTRRRPRSGGGAGTSGRPASIGLSTHPHWLPSCVRVDGQRHSGPSSGWSSW